LEEADADDSLKKVTSSEAATSDLFDDLDDNDLQIADSDDGVDFLESLITSEEETGISCAYFVSPRNDKVINSNF